VKSNESTGRRWIFSSARNTSNSAYWFNTFIALAGFSFLVYLSFTSLGYDLMWKGVWSYRSSFLQGYLMTIILSIVALVLSTVLGVLVGLAQQSKVIFLRILARGYVEIIRGTPILVQILIFYYVIANSLGIDNRLLVGICIMSIFSSAYIAEIFRSGIESVSKSQLETAMSLGFTNRQIYQYIIFPQVVTRILPPLTGQFAALIKDSSLLSVIAIKEVTMAAREINAATFSTLESYLPLAVCYLLLTIPISLLTRKLEKKYSYEY